MSFAKASIAETWQKLLQKPSSSLTRNISEVFAGDLVSRGIGAFTILLIIRGLPVNDYATYTAFWAVSTMIPALVGSGINMAVVRFSAEHISKTNQKPLELYMTAIAFEASLYIALWIGLSLSGNAVSAVLFGKEVPPSALYFGLAAGFGTLLLEAGRTAFQAEERFRRYILTSWINQVSNFIIILVLFLAGLMTFERVAEVRTAISTFIGLTVVGGLLNGFRPRSILKFLKEKFDLVKDFIYSSSWLVGYFFILIAQQRLDVFFLSHFGTQMELANYGVALQLYSLGVLVLGSINAVLLPKFSKLEMLDPAKQKEFSMKWLKKAVWVIIPLGLGDLVGKPLFVLVTSIKYAEAFQVFEVLTLGIWLSLMFSPLVNVILARKGFRFLFSLSFVSLVVSIAGNFYLDRLWGGIGAAVTTLVAQNIVIQGFIFLKLSLSKANEINR